MWGSRAAGKCHVIIDEPVTSDETEKQGRRRRGNKRMSVDRVRVTGRLLHCWYWEELRLISSNAWLLFYS